MNFKFRPLALAAGLAAVTAFSGSALAMKRIPGEALISSKSEASVSLRQPWLPDSQSAVVSLGPANTLLIEEIQQRNAVITQKALQVGVTRRLKDELVQSPALRWVAHSDGGRIARLVVASQDARALRVGLDVAALPAGAELRFASPTTPSLVHAVGANEIANARRESTTFWTPLTEGAQQVIEIYLPPGASPAAVSLAVESTSHIFATPSLGFKEAKALGASGSCNRDVVCETPTTALTNIKNAVAWMQYQSGGSSFICTGTLLNDGDVSTQVPYFYSARHCIGTQTEASTLNTIWGYERATCGTGTAPTNNIVAGGADLLYTDSNRDVLLLKLRNPPPAGAYFAGWDANTIADGASLTAIHHPSGDAKKISKGQFMGYTALSDFGGQRFYTAAWTSGTTEGGSSGSGLFTLSGSEYYLRGGLYGGSAACSNSGSTATSTNRDWYSRFDEAYPALRKYLAVDYSGAWSVENEDGIGLSIAQGESSATLGVIWYQFTPAPERKPIWFILAGSWTGLNTFSGNWLQLSRTGYSEPYNAAIRNDTTAGTASITFTSPTKATMSFTLPGGVSGTKNLVKLSF